jgi:hypothetical protein
MQRGDDIESIAAEIVRYLEAHPHAADTLDGIRNWWLQRTPTDFKVVECALKRLVADGVLKLTTAAGAKPVYSRTQHDLQSPCDT